MIFQGIFLVQITLYARMKLLENMLAIKENIIEAIIEHIVAEITSISEEEYNILKEALEENEEIIIEPDDGNDEPEIPVIPDQPEDPDITLEFVRNSKLSEMSRACRETIESGIEIMIRGETKHFSLTTQDQLNLMSLSVMAQTQSLIPYHADGEETDFYTSEEINQIVEAANALKIQHTTYGKGK